MNYLQTHRFSKLLLRLKIASVVVAISLLFFVSVDVAEAKKAAGCMVPKKGKVQKTFNQMPFEYQAKLVDEKDDYCVFRVTYPSPIKTEYEPNNTVPADYFLPKGIKPGEKRPAVVCLHILNGRFELVNMVCSALAKRGVPAIMIKLPYYGERALPGGFSSFERQGDRFCAGLFQGFEDIRRTVDFLESRPEVDKARIGVTGMSLGAIVSARVAADEPRFSKVVIIFGGGDLAYIIDNAKEARQIKEYLAKLPEKARKKFDKEIHEIDPVTYAHKLKERAKAGMVWMYNGGVDETITPRSARKLAAAMGMEDKIKWYEDVGHYTFFGVLPKTLNETVEFFADDVPAPKEEEKQAEEPLRTGDQMVTDLLQQLNKLMAVEPQSGCYHEIDLAAQASPKGEKPWKGRLCFTRGSGSKFKMHIAVQHPMKFEMTLGANDECPWIASPGKGVVFCGTKPSEDEVRKPLEGPLGGVKPEYMQGWGMAKGAVSVISMSPALLEQLVVFEEAFTSGFDKDARRRIKVKPKRKLPADLMFSCPWKGQAIDRLDFEAKGFVGNVSLARFCTDEKDDADRFAPPKDLKRVEVERESVHRTISSTINFLAEKAK